MTFLFSLSLLNYDCIHPNRVWSWPMIGSRRGPVLVTLELKVCYHFLSLFYILTVKHLFFCSSPHSPIRISKTRPPSIPAYSRYPNTSCTLPPPKRTHPLPQTQYLVHLHMSWMTTIDYDEDITESLLTLSHYGFASFIVTCISTTPWFIMTRISTTP